MDLDTLIHDPGVQTASAILISVFVIFNIAEIAWSKFRSNGYSRVTDLIVNITLALFQQLSDVFNKLVFILGYVFVQENISVQSLMGWPGIPAGSPVTVSAGFPFIHFHALHIGIWLGILLLADFCQYWLHRLSHEVNLLWAGHIVHHSMDAYNFSVALRQSFIESLYTWIFYLPLAFLGIPWPLFIMAYAISLAWQFLVHTCYIDKLGWLEGFMSTPSHHRVHHGKNDRYIDKNYGALLIIWDKLFGTFEPESEPVEYGVKSGLGTHSPVWVNIHHYVRIGRLLESTHSWRNRFRVLFGPPAYVPDDSPEPETVRSLRFPVLPWPKKAYILLNFIIIAAFAVWQLLEFDRHGNALIMAISAACFAGSHVVNIALLENRKWADNAEVFRLLSLISAGAALNICFQWNTGILLAMSAMLLLGLTFWIAQDDKQRQIRGLHAH